MKSKSIISASVDTEVLDKFDAIASETNSTRSRVVALALKQWLESQASNLVKVEGM